MSKRIDPATLPSITGTLYPSPFDEPCRTRQRIRLGDPAGLTQYGVNLLRLPPDMDAEAEFGRYVGDLRAATDLRMTG